MPTPESPAPTGIDWRGFFEGLAWLVAGAGAAIGALWKKLKGGSAPASTAAPASPRAEAVSVAGILEEERRRREHEETLASLRDAEDRLRGATDSMNDSLIALGSQINGARELQAELRGMLSKRK